MMKAKFKNVDHSFMTVGKLGAGIENQLIGGDQDSWGSGAEYICSLDLISPTRGKSGPSLIYCNGASFDLQDWQVKNHEVASFLKEAIDVQLRDDEIEFVLWEFTRTIYGRELGKKSGFPLDEWPVADLHKEIGADLEGRLIVHFNRRYNCAVTVSEEGEVEWAGNVDPDDDAQFVAVFCGDN
jgi:hypothetical protein